VKEDIDLGGWGPSTDNLEIPEYFGVGRFIRHLEKFDPDDDCDRELYF
jgi:hypothetical protein